MSGVQLSGITKSYGSRTVIDSLDLDIPAQGFTVLVGPSGCGKSSTLRLIAGLEQPDAGRITIGDRDVTGLAPGDRGVAMVFQNYALYPTMSVEKNIEYGLRNTGVPKAERRALIEEIAETVGLADHLRKPPSALSGGERQRVALARAMVRKPRVFLMDEPLSNLDARLRQHMRAELVELHARVDATFVYVTHDQVEAMSMGTRIVLMDAGAVMQEASPVELYRHPRNEFAARFIGSPAMNVVPAAALAAAGEAVLLEQDPPAGASSLGFRPEHARLVQGDADDSALAADSDVLVLEGTVVSVEFLGAEHVARVRLASGDTVAVRRFGDGDEAPGRGTATVLVPRARLVWFDAEHQSVEAKAGVEVEVEPQEEVLRP